MVKPILGIERFVVAIRPIVELDAKEANTRLFVRHQRRRSLVECQVRHWGRERDELRARVRGIYWRDVMIGGRMKQADWILSPDQHSALMKLLFPDEDSPNA